MTDVKPDAHPISLDQVYFTRTVIIAIPEFQPAEASTKPPENVIDVTPIEGRPGRYLATMRTTLNPTAGPTCPYSIDVECLGTFVADDTLSADEARRGVIITAHSVLYGAIREAVSWITGRHIHGSFTLGLSVLQMQPPPPGE